MSRDWEQNVHKSVQLLVEFHKYFPMHICILSAQQSSDWLVSIFIALHEPPMHCGMVEHASANVYASNYQRTLIMYCLFIRSRFILTIANNMCPVTSKWCTCRILQCSLFIDLIYVLIYVPWTGNFAMMKPNPLEYQWMEYPCKLVHHIYWKVQNCTGITAGQLH